MKIEKGTKLICKKSITIADNVENKFVKWFIRVTSKNFYTKGKTYEVSDFKINHMTKDIVWVRMKANKVEYYVDEMFIVDKKYEMSGVEVKLLGDYFVFDKKELRKLKLERIESR